MRRALTLGLVIGLVLVTAPGAPEPKHVLAAEPRPTPSAPIEPAAIDPIALRLAELTAGWSVEQKLRQLLMIHCPGQDPGALAACAGGAGVGGVIFLGDNVPADPAALPALSASARGSGPLPRLLAIDQEGGVVSRLPWEVAPAGSALAALPPAETTAAFTSRAEALRAAGIRVNFGVVADVTAEPGAFLYDRVLGHDPAAAAERVTAAVAAERGKVASTLKHFPGHGAAPGDSHSSVPVTARSLAEWRANEARPFVAGIAAGAELVMTSHVAYTAVDAAPASLSAEWHRILRQELGFRGVVVSDDLLMLQRSGLPEFADPTSNAIRALAAGTDLLLFVLPADPASVGVSIDGLVAGLAGAVADGRIPAERLDEALERVLRLRLALSEPR